MKWKGSLSRTLLGVFLAALLLGGCTFLTELFNPLTGTWHTTFDSSGTQVTEDATLKPDGSFSVVIASPAGTQTKSGTWTHDVAAKTVTFAITSPSAETQVFGYSISADRNTLVLTFVSTTGSSTPPSTLTFTRTA